MARRNAAPSDFDLAMMRRAVALAKRGLGATYPNPSVGALVVQGDRVISTGRTAPTGGPHAEARAIAKAGEDARGATLYVTLEPCSHHGRTPPCTDAIIRAGMARVVYGVDDVAAHASGRARAILRKAGVVVDVGPGAEQCARVHEHYLHHVERGVPFVTLKTAASLDGRVSVRTGDSKWITSSQARKVGHGLRAEHHAIAVGIGTVLADDPSLTVRMTKGVDPKRVVFDSTLRLASARKKAVCAPGTIVLHTAAARAQDAKRLQECGVETVRVQATKDGRVSVRGALRALGRADVRSLLVEGGGALVGAFAKANAWDRWFWFTAPKVLGEGTAAVDGVSWAKVSKTPALHVERRKTVGDDLLTVLRPQRDAL
jgi:diaminohydroxyphosphoribosylaminopyrimidine deaminase/5-amino-6-(5-phosphoribosylamino)uracil reductase